MPSPLRGACRISCSNETVCDSESVFAACWARWLHSRPSMRIAIPIADNRVSPVFDVARRLLVADAQRGVEASRTEEALEEESLELRARRIAELSVNVLICGAISRPLQAMLVSAGVEVIPQTCGQVDEVLRTFLSGQLEGDAFVMPGCCGRRRRFRGGRGRGRRC